MTLVIVVITGPFVIATVVLLVERERMRRVHAAEVARWQARLDASVDARVADLARVTEAVRGLGDTARALDRFADMREEGK